MYRRGRREALPPPRSLLQGTSVDAGKRSTLSQQDGVSKEPHWRKEKKSQISTGSRDPEKADKLLETQAKSLIGHSSLRLQGKK